MQQELVTSAEEAFHTPQWVHNAVFYQIFPDRFARSWEVHKPSNLEPWDSPPTTHGFKGGDLLGVVEHLDYLQDLGVSALYLNPIFRSTANHRYHTHDYYVVDPILGGNEAFERLLSEAHKRGMQMILDGVFNHAGRGFYQFSHLLENGQQSPYLDWFHVNSWPLHPYPEGEQQPGYACWWNMPALPKLDTGTPAVREFLWAVGEYWVRQGIDGWRLDVPSEIDDDDFWREFRRKVKSANPDAYIVGEIWNEARRWLAGDQFDGVTNYLFTRACLSFFAGGAVGLEEAVAQTGLAPLHPCDAQGFRAAIDALLDLYSWPATLAQLNMLSSHDIPRYLTLSGGDESALRLATLFQMTFPGAPCIYYGDEIGLEGGHDPANRGSFPWDRGLWNDGLHDFVKRCVALRHEHPVFRLGHYVSLSSQDDVYVYARTLEDDLAVVALNAGHGPQRIDVQLPLDGKPADLQSIWGELLPETSDGTIRGWDLPPRSGRVLLGRREAAQPAD